jgi:minor histocompatibility antigen H13
MFNHFQAAQPALLYLVPSCLILPLMVATCRGELRALWNYSEEHLVERDDEEKKKKAAAAEQQNATPDSTGGGKKKQQENKKSK